MRSRACENQVHLADANRNAREGPLTYGGESCVVGPDGVDLASAGSGDELLLAEIDAALHAAPRADNTHLGDRRPELYASLVDGAPATREETSR